MKQQKKKKGRSVQELMGIKTFTKYGLSTNKGELLFYLVSPTNISVLSHTNIEIKIRHLMMVLSALPDIEIVCTDSSECFDDILVDFDRRAEDKTTSNILILGNSGQGKSYLLKLILTNIRESGKRIICLDPESEYAAMQSIKAEKNTQKDVNHTEGIFTLNAPVVCYNCGGRMHRRFDRRRKATTWWQCPECKASINISDEDMLGGITELLNEVITDPESIQIPKSDHEESQEIKRLNTEISKALNTFGFDKEAIKQKMLTCVSEKYTSLGTEEITAQSLKDIFKTVPPLTAYDSDLTDQAVSEIQLKGNGTISLVLINGQRIGKEKSA